jgi:O-antigen/teichoic acid export membrane protein
MSGLYRKVGNTFFLKVFGLGIAFIFQIVLGRILEPNLYGQYTMYLTYTTVLSIIAILGMDRNLIKEVAKEEDNKNKSDSLLQYALLISFSISVVLIFIILLTRKHFNLSYSGYFVFIAMLIIKTLVALLDGFLQGKGQVVQVTVFNSVVNNILKIVMFIGMILFGISSLTAALMSFVISEIITVCIRFTNIKKLLSDGFKFEIILNSNEKKRFVKYSAIVALTSGIGLMLQNVDKIMISAYLNLESVGIYKVSQNYVSLLSVFIAPFIAFWPVISKLYNENNTKQIEIEMKKIVRIVTYLVVPMFFIFLFLSDDLLRVFGGAYVTKEGQTALIILAFAFLIDAVSGPIGSILTMTNYAKYILYNNIISLILNVLLNYLLIKNYGIIGVAVGTGASIIVNNLISIIEVKVILGIFSYDRKNVIEVIVLSFLNYLACIILNGNLKISSIYLNIIIFSMLLYLINIVIMLIIQRKNIKNLLVEWRT